jgi:type IV pilus assembly protein PilA
VVIIVSYYMNLSLKQDLALAAMYNPVSVGMLAAMAVPAFQKVRVASQEKAVMNNLRQLSAAAEQHYLENGVATARYDDLVGPDRYIRRLEPVAGEDYRTVTLQAGKPLKVRLKDGREVEYRP